MTDKQRGHFELINESVWLLLKKYVKDDEIYKQIMKDVFRLYVKFDNADNKLSDTWWEEVIQKFKDYPEKYKDTELKDFAADFGIGICDYWEIEKKRTPTYTDFYKCICKAFVNEWERLKT